MVDGFRQAGIAADIRQSPFIRGAFTRQTIFGAALVVGTTPIGDINWRMYTGAP